MTMLFEQLWNGNIAPYKTCGKDDPEVEELAELVQKNKAALDMELTEKSKKALEKYIACCEEYYYLMIVHAFKDGFSLASKLMTEALSEDIS